MVGVNFKNIFCCSFENILRYILQNACHVDGNNFSCKCKYMHELWHNYITNFLGFGKRFGYVSFAYTYSIGQNICNQIMLI